MSLAARYGLTSPYLAQWQATLARMTWFPVDAASGTLEIYRGIPYGTPHRHFSHLFSIWPLHLLNVSNATQYTLAQRSINLWLATPERDSMFYRPAASAMNVILGQRAAAFDNITDLLHSRLEGSGWYREGTAGSCTETPYAASWAVADWMLQSWNHTTASTPPHAVVIDVFPGIDDTIRLDGSAYDSAPARAASASFYRLAASGGVVVSSARAVVTYNATHYVTRTAFVAVEAPAAAPSSPIVVRTNMARPLGISPASVAFVELGDGGLVQLSLGAGESAVLFSSLLPTPAFAITASAGCPSEFNHFGVSPAAAAPTGAHVVLRDCTGASTQRYSFNVTSGTFALQDGSGRCLGVASCAAANGDRIVLAPCAAAGVGAALPAIGCEAAPSCDVATQTWRMTGPTAHPPNAIISSISGRCVDINGAFDPDTIDVYNCDDPPGADRNEEWVFVEATGEIQSLDTNACCLNKCLTPAAAQSE